MWSPSSLVLATLCSSLALTSASPSPPLHARSTGPTPAFIHNSGFSFAFEADSSTGDLYFAMEAPDSYGWVGVGIGEQMAGSLLFAMYASGQGNGVTVSQRVAVAEIEPNYQSSVQFTMMGTNSVTSTGMLQASGVCKNCSTWVVPSGGTGSIDFTSTSQPFIFALGPNQMIKSTSKSAELFHHNTHGHFTIDMTQASATSNVTLPSLTPASNSSSSGSGSGGSVVVSSYTDSAWTKWTHIVFGLFGLIILFPASVVWLRVFESVLFHWLNNILGAICVIIGASIGIWWSKQVKPQDNYRSAHQVIGLLILSLVIVQVCLGFAHHLIFRRTQKKTLLSPVHRILGSILILLGIAQGFVGFSYAGEASQSWPLAIIIVGWVGGCAALVVFKGKSRKQVEHDIYTKTADSPTADLEKPPSSSGPSV